MLDVPAQHRARGSGAKLVSRHTAPLARSGCCGLGEPRVAERAIAPAGKRPAPVLDARALAQAPAPRVARLTAMQAPEDVLVARLAQPREGGRVAAALREAVPAEPQCVRPAPQPQA